MRDSNNNIITTFKAIQTVTAPYNLLILNSLVRDSSNNITTTFKAIPTVTAPYKYFILLNYFAKLVLGWINQD